MLASKKTPDLKKCKKSRKYLEESLKKVWQQIVMILLAPIADSSFFGKTPGIVTVSVGFTAVITGLLMQIVRFFNHSSYINVIHKVYTLIHKDTRDFPISDFEIIEMDYWLGERGHGEKKKKYKEIHRVFHGFYDKIMVDSKETVSNDILEILEQLYPKSDDISMETWISNNLLQLELVHCMGDLIYLCSKILEMYDQFDMVVFDDFTRKPLPNTSLKNKDSGYRIKYVERFFRDINPILDNPNDHVYKEGIDF